MLTNDRRLTPVGYHENLVVEQSKSSRSQRFRRRRLKKKRELFRSQQWNAFDYLTLLWLGVWGFREGLCTLRYTLSLKLRPYLSDGQLVC